MVVRKETQQTGVTVNPSEHRNVPCGVRALATILAMVTTMALMLLCVPTPTASADEESSADMLTIDSSTSVMTDSSGYHLKATVTNTTEQTIPEGTLTVAINAFYTFVSRNDIQEWSEGDAHIPTPEVVAEVTVPSLQPGASTNVSVDADASQESLASINAWGPKPVLVSYQADGNDFNDLHTFVTRTGAGLNTSDTPAMDITIVQPLAATGWSSDNTIVEELVEDGGISSSELEKIATPNEDDDTRLGALKTVIDKHAGLQVVADPTYLKSMTMPTKVSGITQPGLFDITGYSAMSDGNAYTSAGVKQDSWSADSSISDYRSALGDSEATTSVYAWQGNGNWTKDALTQAKQQGYDTVIATRAFEDNDSFTVQTGKYVVSTDAGDITVLAAQSVLSGLAQGQATSDDAAADGEGSAAGRLARFVAQSAFYQMEQPYSSRNLLVCLNTDTDANTVDALMNAVEQSPWLNLTNLDELSSVETTLAGNDAEYLIPQEDGLTDDSKNSIRGILDSLASSASEISRFNSNIVKKTEDNSGKKAASWGRQLVEAHNIMALHALSHGASSNSVAEDAWQLASLLVNGISITPTENVSVVSETAKMPVTVSNSHPYPIKVKISSLTNSSQIVTSRIDTIEVPAHSDAQVAFTIRVLTSGEADATLTLLDRQGTAFGSTQVTHITSVLQISDKSGFVIIGISVALGALGLWRQFHRKKDPDE